MPFSLDTNSVIALMNRRPEALRERVRRCSPGEVSVSSIVLHELWWGAFKSGRVEANLDRIARLRFPVLDFDADDANAAGRIRAELQLKGTPIGPYDLLIAGQALVRGLTLVTANRREFERVEGLAVEDWTAPA
jgi:tRNA(fMet)-specific endonuclease VapC